MTAAEAVGAEEGWGTGCGAGSGAGGFPPRWGGGLAMREVAVGSLRDLLHPPGLVQLAGGKRGFCRALVP